jgi:hypothetical protein
VFDIFLLREVDAIAVRKMPIKGYQPCTSAEKKIPCMKSLEIFLVRPEKN